MFSPDMFPDICLEVQKKAKLPRATKREKSVFEDMTNCSRPAGDLRNNDGKYVVKKSGRL